MGIERFFDIIATQKRKTSATGARVEAWIVMSNTLRCCIYPISASDSLAFKTTDFRLNITHKMNCWKSEDIKIDDKLVTGNDEYIVKKINDWGRFLEVFLSEVR